MKKVLLAVFAVSSIAVFAGVFTNSHSHKHGSNLNNGQIRCNFCRGTGFNGNFNCPMCRGTGRTMSYWFLTVKVKRSIVTIVLATLWCCQYVYAFESEKVFYFANDGKIKNCSNNNFIVKKQVYPLCYRYEITSNGCFVVVCDGQAFSGHPGDYIIPLIADGKFIWLISEKNCNFASIVKWDVKKNKVENFSVPEYEATGIVADGGNVYACVFGYDRSRYIQMIK